MRVFIQGIGFFICTITAIVAWINLLLLTIPLYTGRMFADEPDPDRPGHLRGVIVTTPQIVLESIIALASLACAIWLWKYRPKSESQSYEETQPRPTNN